MATQRDISVGATWRRLVELGYSPTSETHPDRVISQVNRISRDPLTALADHPAAIHCFPTQENGASVDDGDKRRVVDLIVTAFLASQPAEFKAIMTVLDKFELSSGPCQIDGFGNRHFPLQWHGSDPVFDRRYRARLCHSADDQTVLLQQAIEPRYVYVRGQYGEQRVGMAEPIGTYVIPLNGEWKNSHILDTPYRKLPELLSPDADKFIEEVEYARWYTRPLAAKAQAA